MSDLIDRQAVLNMLHRECSTIVEDFLKEKINALPSEQHFSQQTAHDSQGLVNDYISKQDVLDVLERLPVMTDSDGWQFISKRCAKIRIDLLPSAQPEIIRCKDCKYKKDRHYEGPGEESYIKSTCDNKYGLAKGYQVHGWEFCSRAERREE